MAYRVPVYGDYGVSQGEPTILCRTARGHGDQEQSRFMPDLLLGQGRRQPYGLPPPQDNPGVSARGLAKFRQSVARWVMARWW